MGFSKNKTNYFRYWIFILLAFSALSSFAFNLPTKLTTLQISPFGENTRLVFSLSGPFGYDCFSLSKPDRLVVDFVDSKLFFSVKNLKLENSAIKNIRVGHPTKDKLRLVFALKQMMRPKAYILRPHGNYGYRLVIDLLPSTTGLITEKPKNKKVVEKIIQPEAKLIVPTKTEPAIPKKLRNAVVVIDPGHGGKDPGATGLRGTHEKDVVLAISKNLYDLLKQQPGIEPKLTRSGDYFVPLRGRLVLARKGSTDVFVAIHADAYNDHFARGASVYALSQRGATSEAARWLAQKENYSELMGGVDLSDKSYLVRSVLLDLSQTATIQDSLKLGSFMLRSLDKYARVHRYRVEQAPFMVLKSPDIPSVLVEIGFISNSQEELLLRNPVYQHKIAFALMEGIVNYLHKYPPPDTLLAVRK